MVPMIRFARRHLSAAAIASTGAPKAPQPPGGTGKEQPVPSRCGMRFFNILFKLRISR